ncbi:MAG: GPW/gp25 family protein [Minisyncoccia bacterium]
MAIKLNIARATTEVEKALESGYLYKDVDFDLKLSFTDNSELYKQDEKKDLAPIYDVKAVITSIKNILTTSPGEKILNPVFGLDLRDYLFEPVSETGAFCLGRDLYDGLTLQEPRIRLNTIRIKVYEDEQQYNIDLDISIPSLNVNNLSLKGVLNNDGYTFV